MAGDALSVNSSHPQETDENRRSACVARAAGAGCGLVYLLTTFIDMQRHSRCSYRQLMMGWHGQRRLHVWHMDERIAASTLGTVVLAACFGLPSHLHQHLLGST